MLSDDTLLTIGDIAKLLNISEATITSYKARNQMPKPDVKYSRTPLWTYKTIKDWRKPITPE